MTKISVFHSPGVRTQLGELGDTGDGGRLRYLRGKVDTTISYVCVHVLLALPSVLCAWSMALVLWLPFECCYYCYCPDPFL